VTVEIRAHVVPYDVTRPAADGAGLFMGAAGFEPATPCL
jgi:hypothetical protein